jgi:serine/threonine protein kinase
VGVVRGLVAAHECSVLHRDLKPANLMLDEHKDVVLVDFGLAKLAGELAPAGPAGNDVGALGATAVIADPPMTATGIALGTPRYMAPETWRGADATPQTDLYSLGVVLYELLSGRAPFTATRPEELARLVCTEDAAPIAQQAPWMSPVFGALVDRCLARDPAARPRSAAALLDELESLQRGHAFDEFERDRVRRAPPGNP